MSLILTINHVHSTDKKLHKLLIITISERSDRGVPKIVSKHGKDAIQIEKK